MRGAAMLEQSGRTVPLVAPQPFAAGDRVRPHFRLESAQNLARTGWCGMRTMASRLNRRAVTRRPDLRR